MSIQTVYTASDATNINVTAGDNVRSRYRSLVLQRALRAFNGSNHPEDVRQETNGMTRALTSAPNTQGVTMEALSIDEASKPLFTHSGSVMTRTSGGSQDASTNARVEISWRPTACVTPEDAVAEFCGDKNIQDDPLRYAVVTVPHVRNSGFSVNEEVYRQLTYGRAEDVAIQLSEHIRGHERARNKQHIKDFYKNSGFYFTGTNPSKYTFTAGGAGNELDLGAQITVSYGEEYVSGMFKLYFQASGSPGITELVEGADFSIDSATEITLAAAYASGDMLAVVFDAEVSSVDSRDPASRRKLYPFEATPNHPNAMAFFPIVQNYNRQGYSSPIVVGSQTLDKWGYADSIYQSDTAAGNGRDITRLPGGLSFAQDYDVDAAVIEAALEGEFGMGEGFGEKMLSWAAGHIQQLQYAENVGLYRRVEQNLEKSTITSNGFTYDFGYFRPQCDAGGNFSGRHNFNIQQRFGMFVTPFGVDGCTAGSSLCLWDVERGQIPSGYGLTQPPY